GADRDHAPDVPALRRGHRHELALAHAPADAQRHQHPHPRVLLHDFTALPLIGFLAPPPGEDRVASALPRGEQLHALFRALRLDQAPERDLWRAPDRRVARAHQAGPVGSAPHLYAALPQVPHIAGHLAWSLLGEIDL